LKIPISGLQIFTGIFTGNDDRKENEKKAFPHGKQKGLPQK